MQNHLGMALIVAAVAIPAASFARDPGPIVGVDVGAMIPDDQFDEFVETGGVFSPFGGYMFNDYIGLMGQLHVWGAETKQADRFDDDDATFAFAALAGPRVALPVGLPPPTT